MASTPHAPIAVGLAEAARLTSLSRRSIEYLCHDGRLASRKVGKRRLILYADLRRYLGADRPADIVPEAAQ